MFGIHPEWPKLSFRHCPRGNKPCSTSDKQESCYRGFIQNALGKVATWWAFYWNALSGKQANTPRFGSSCSPSTIMIFFWIRSAFKLRHSRCVNPFLIKVSSLSIA